MAARVQSLRVCEGVSASGLRRLNGGRTFLTPGALFEVMRPIVAALDKACFEPRRNY